MNQYLTLIVEDSDRDSIQTTIRQLLGNENLSIATPLARPDNDQVVTHYCCTFTTEQVDVDLLAQFLNIIILTGHPIQQLAQANFVRYIESEE